MSLDFYVLLNYIELQKKRIYSSIKQKFAITHKQHVYPMPDGIRLAWGALDIANTGNYRK